MNLSTITQHIKKTIDFDLGFCPYTSNSLIYNSYQKEKSMKLLVT